LYLLAIIQHRPVLRPEAVPEPLRIASSRFRTVLADELQVLGARLIGKNDRADLDLKKALNDLERTVISQAPRIANADVAAQIRARLLLHQKAVPIVQQITRLKLEQ
jgi:hypothetical protein